MNKFALAFRWTVIVGILQDWFFAFPGLFAPAAILQFVAAEPVIPPFWPRYACFLLMLLSFAYVPGAIDPYRYSAFALFAVVARLGGVVFFSLVYPGAFPILFLYIDLSLTVIQGTSLMLAYITSGPVVPRNVPAVGAC